MASQSSGNGEGGDNQRRRVRPRLELEVDYNPFAPPAAEYGAVASAQDGRPRQVTHADAGPVPHGSSAGGPALTWLLHSRSALLDLHPPRSSAPASSPANTHISRSPSASTPTYSSMSSSPPPDRISGHKRTRVPADDDLADEDGATQSGTTLELGQPIHQVCVHAAHLAISILRPLLSEHACDVRI